jgi:5-methylcytosine-specific restriction endonuclease McrA
MHSNRRGSRSGDLWYDQRYRLAYLGAKINMPYKDIEVGRAHARKYQQEHKAEKAAYKANWQKENVKRLSAEHLIRDHLRIEQVKINKEKWRKANPESRKIAEARRRTRKTKAGGSFTLEEWHNLCAKYEFKCLCCKELKPLTADHVIPVSLGGTSNIDNIQPLCQSCNSKKHTGTIDFRETQWNQQSIVSYSVMAFAPEAEKIRPAQPLSKSAVSSTT